MSTMCHSTRLVNDTMLKPKFLKALESCLLRCEEAFLRECYAVSLFNYINAIKKLLFTKGRNLVSETSKTFIPRNSKLYITQLSLETKAE